MDRDTAAFVRFRSTGDLQALGEVFDVPVPRRARRCELRIDTDTPLPEGEGADVQVRRGDGVVVLHKTATRGPSGLVVECVLPVGEFAVEVRRQDRITHRAEIAVSRALQDRNAFAVPPVR